MPYCTSCGKELFSKGIGSFDFNTGKEHVEFRCPTLKCGHVGWPHRYHPRSSFEGFFLVRRICMYCGERE